MRVVGLDLSLTATGLCGTDGSAARTIAVKSRGVKRLVELRDAVLRGCWTDGDYGGWWVDLVVIEGYSMGGQRGSAGIGQALGELGGVVRVALHENGLTWVDVPPASLKKFATGKGNANKVAMATAATRAGYDGPDDDNAIDAWWLRQMGLYAACDTAGTDTAAAAHDVAHTAYRDEAIAKVTWPPLANTPQEGVA